MRVSASFTIPDDVEDPEQYIRDLVSSGASLTLRTAKPRARDYVLPVVPVPDSGPRRDLYDAWMAWRASRLFRYGGRHPRAIPVRRKYVDAWETAERKAHPRLIEWLLQAWHAGVVHDFYPDGRAREWVIRWTPKTSASFPDGYQAASAILERFWSEEKFAA